ncbi:MAG: outer membrane receptor protein involved in Fe transport [Oceanicoccus sp.]|jgi:outer membrane receptor protein involved in Fe transport
MAINIVVPSLLVLTISSIITSSAVAQDRKIEEVVVTAEKREATVSDTSISITAFTAQSIEDFGIQSADELINYIPATTRDSYDIRIRGVGRNFRALGGDAGVATYYNGIYSPDFGIASSEGGLYDLERVEVLRGPQGTLYGRNAIGGALNYVTKKATYDVEGNVRVQVGDFDTQEIYGVLSGPIIADKLAARLVVSKRDRDGWQDGLNGYDTDSTDDQNVALSLNWMVSDAVEVNFRANDRESDRIIGNDVLISEGAGDTRGIRSTDHYVLGFREVAPGTPGGQAFTEPNTGEVKWGANIREGVDRNAWPHQPNAAYGQDGLAKVINGASKSDPNLLTTSNNEGGDCDVFPSTENSCNAEYFGHRSGHLEVKWNINEEMSLTYLFGHTDFDYTYNQDIDYSDADFSKYRQTVKEDVSNRSHELQLQWSLGDSWTATSGLYFFEEGRDQDYSLTNSTNRYKNAVTYGALEGFITQRAGGFLGSQVPLGGAADHATGIGTWDGDPRGDAYHHQNRLENQAAAVYTQGTYVFNDEFSLVLGLRWAEDKKNAVEERILYFEELPGNPAGSFMNYLLAPTTAYGFPCGVSSNVLECFSGSFDATGMGLTNADYGRTPLSQLNVIMGRATWADGGGIDPVCDLQDASCTTPLLLGGIPMSQTSRTSGKDTWSDVNYRVNLDWTPNEDMLLYFSVTTGYRAGGYALGVTDSRDVPRDSSGTPAAGVTVLGDPFAYDEETVVSLEVGYKGMHLDDTLSLNLSLYRYDYDNYQDRLNVFDQNRGRSVDIVQNADSAINMGFEVETMWYPTNELSIGGNYSYTDTEYSDTYLVVLDNQPSAPESLFGNATTNPDLYVVDAEGSELKRIPKHKFTVWGSYEWQTEFGPIALRATYAYTGEMQSNGVADDLDLVEDRFQLDTSVGWSSVDDKWKARLFVDNVTDENNLRGVTTGNEGTNYNMRGTYLYPRYYGLDVTYSFGG